MTFFLNLTTKLGNSSRSAIFPRKTTNSKNSAYCSLSCIIAGHLWTEGKLTSAFTSSHVMFVHKWPSCSFFSEHLCSVMKEDQEFSFMTTKLITAIREHLQLWFVPTLFKSLKVFIHLFESWTNHLRYRSPYMCFN